MIFNEDKCKLLSLCPEKCTSMEDNWPLISSLEEDMDILVNFKCYVSQLYEMVVE